MVDMPQVESERTLPGRWVVVAMFSFAILVTSLLWLYWKAHTAPFLPLQQAIVAVYPDSAPLVQGGQRKIHQGTPRMLRIVVQVDFDPNADDDQIESMVATLSELAEQNVVLDTYEVVEFQFFQRIPENELLHRTVTRPVADLLRL